MTHARRYLLLCLLLFACAIRPTAAQEVAGADTPAHISVIDGRATLEHDGQADEAQAGVPLAPGDRVRTDEGRLEIVLTEGSVLHLDRFTTIDLQSDALIRLLEGRLLLAAGRNAPKFRVDTPAAAIDVQSAGEYRISSLSGTMGPELELAVLRGWAELRAGEDIMPVRAGERSVVRGNQLPSYPTAFNSAAFDAFDRWSEQRRGAMVGTTSYRYLPPDVATYAGTFDRQGSWSSDPQYGDVWYPRVAPSWRPYYNGYWRPTRRWGSTWIGWDPWAYPTHHFGRWGFTPAGSWFWIPHRRWAPAWVSWATAPGFVSWCPLGFDGRPVIGFNVGANFYAARGVYDPWRAWTVVPRTRFHTTPVPRYVVDPHRLDGGVRSAFATQSAPPRPLGMAVPRVAAGAAPLNGVRAGIGGMGSPASGVPGRVAIPRMSEPGRGAVVGGLPSPGWGRTSPPAAGPYDRAGRAARERSAPPDASYAPRPGSPYDRAGRAMERPGMAVPRSSIPPQVEPRPRSDGWPASRQWRGVPAPTEPARRPQDDGWGPRSPYDGGWRSTPPDRAGGSGTPRPMDGRPAREGGYAVPRPGMERPAPHPPSAAPASPPQGARPPQAGAGARQANPARQAVPRPPR